MAFSPHNLPTLPYQPQANRVQILNATGQTFVTGYTAGANGSKIVGVIATSTDGTARAVQIGITNGGTTYPLGTKTVPITAGTIAATPAVNLLDPAVIVGLPYDNDGNPFLYLTSGDTLQFSALTTVTSTDNITIHVFAADF